jgi:hypothetical protein
MEAKFQKSTSAGTAKARYFIKERASAPSYRRRLIARDRAQGQYKVAQLVQAEIMSGAHDELNTYDSARIHSLVKAMTRVLPTHQQPEVQMAAKAGPFYQTATLVEWLGVTRQALSKRAAKRELLAVQDSQGHVYYPDRQFMEDGTALPGLRKVLDVLATGTPVQWTWALWLAGSSSSLSGRTAWDALHSGDLDAVLHSARHDAARWSE